MDKIGGSSYEEYIKNRVEYCLSVGKVTDDMQEGFFNNPKSSIALVMTLLGMQTELAEIADIVKKKVLYGKKMNLGSLMEEMGDFLYFWDLFLFYIRKLSCCEDVNDIMLRFLNEEKLKIRYPENKFSLERSNNRDTEKERQVFSDYDTNI